MNERITSLNNVRSRIKICVSLFIALVLGEQILFYLLL